MSYKIENVLHISLIRRTETSRIATELQGQQQHLMPQRVLLSPLNNLLRERHCELELSGISEATIFPDLDALSRELEDVCVNNNLLFCSGMPNYFDPDADFSVHRRNLPHWSSSTEIAMNSVSM